MAAGGGTQPGRFHTKCSAAVELNTHRTTAWTKTSNNFGTAFSRYPISKGKFCVKVLLVPSSEDLSGLVPAPRYTYISAPRPRDPCLCIGVTTKEPLDSGPELKNMDDLKNSDQHWYATIEKYRSKREGKGHQGSLPWGLASSEGKTAGCWVSESGEFHLCSGESDSGDVMGRGLPTGRPFWGFVAFRGQWKVEANYKVAIPKGHSQLTAPADCPKGGSPVQPKPKARAGHPQDYAGKTFHFVERPPEWLVCAVCQALAHDPVQANCCGNIYCSRCIERWKTRSNSCPTCRSTEQSDPPFNIFRDRSAQQQINSLTVYCPKRKEGCDKKMELSEVESHFTSNNCFLLQPVECEYKRFGCAIVLTRKDMAEHLKGSVESHLQMTTRRVEEMEICLQEQEVRLQEQEVHLQEQEVRLQKQNVSLQEEKAERQLMKEDMNKAFTNIVEKMKQLERRK